MALSSCWLRTLILIVHSSYINVSEVRCEILAYHFLRIMTQFKSENIEEVGIQLNLFEYFRNCFGSW